MGNRHPHSNLPAAALFKPDVVNLVPCVELSSAPVSFTKSVTDWQDLVKEFGVESEIDPTAQEYRFDWNYPGQFVSCGLFQFNDAGQFSDRTFTLLQKKQHVADIRQLLEVALLRLSPDAVVGPILGLASRFPNPDNRAKWAHPKIESRGGRWVLSLEPASPKNVDCQFLYLAWSGVLPQVTP